MYCNLKNHKSKSLIALMAFMVCIHTHALNPDADDIQTLISGNSLKIINRYGASIIYFEPDGSFKHLAEQVKTSSGKWRGTTDSMCAIVLPQPNDPLKEFCFNLKHRKLGDSWVEQDLRNGELTRTLLKDHPKL